jgi:glucose-6-phosphate isomerase
MNAKYGKRLKQYELQAKKPRNYGYIHTILEEKCMTQYLVKKGLKVFEEAGAEVMKQLDERDMIEPKKVYMLTWEESTQSSTNTSCF